jgi:hypothetical protein
LKLQCKVAELRNEKTNISHGRDSVKQMTTERSDCSRETARRGLKARKARRVLMD